MATLLIDAETIPTMGDLLRRLGGIPAERILMKPLPGEATEADLIRLLDGEPKRLCELIDGTLVEKPMGMEEAIVGRRISTAIGYYADELGLGETCGSEGPVRVVAGNVRMPDISFFLFENLPGRKMPKGAVCDLVPDIAVEVISKGNTRTEIRRKREELFASGMTLFWEVDHRKKTVSVFTSPLDKIVLGEKDTLTGGEVLPGLIIPINKLFRDC